MSFYDRCQRFRSSFRYRLFAIFTLLTAVSTALSVALLLFFEIRDRKADLTHSSELLAANLADDVRLPLFAENIQALEHLAADTLHYETIHSVAIISADNRLMAVRKRPGAPVDSNLVSITAPVQGGALSLSPEEAISGSAARTDRAIGVVRLEVDTRDMRQRLHMLAANIICISLFFWLLTVITAYLALQRLTRSFSDLVDGVGTIRDGDYHARVTLPGEDEPSRVASAINEMAAALERREIENKWLQEELIKSMQLEVQDEKKQIMAKLIQTNRMTSLGLLASSMAHEINTPNGAIRLAGHYLADAWHDALPVLDMVAREEGDFVLGGQRYQSAREGIIRSVEVVDRCSRRIEEVVSNLRNYYLGDRSTVREKVAVQQVVTDALVIVKAHTRQGSWDLKSAVADDLPLVAGKKGQLEQVVVNLVINAINALPDAGGEVCVTAAFDRDAGRVLVMVSDNGAGIDPEAMPRLLEPFYSTRLEEGGSGLGLYISNFIVSEHGGTLDFDSAPGQGTRVTVSLPVLPAA